MFSTFSTYIYGFMCPPQNEYINKLLQKNKKMSGKG